MFYGSIMMLIGFQMLQFAVFTGVFGKRIGQFPPDVTFSERVCSFIEKRGYLCACILFLLGFVGVVYTLVVWAQAGVGGLSTSWVAKTGILFGSLAAVGIEMFLFTVFSRVLQIGNQVD